MKEGESVRIGNLIRVSYLKNYTGIVRSLHPGVAGDYVIFDGYKQSPQGISIVPQGGTAFLGDEVEAVLGLRVELRDHLEALALGYDIWLGKLTLGNPVMGERCEEVLGEVIRKMVSQSGMVLTYSGTNKLRQQPRWAISPRTELVGAGGR